ncbi:MAG: RNA ligase, partial [Candidatus Korarchaeota archaeon]|nr:RNA ligase [Candidatus Korarchaeota archaeon]
MSAHNAIYDVLSDILGVGEAEARRLAEKRRVFRLMRYRDITYLVVRREAMGLREGTSILIRGGDYRVVPGYPSIRRILLLDIAVPRHFPGKVVVEEKMDGYNVRVVRAWGEIYAVTRGGYICPYTTARLRRMYGGALEALGDDETVIAGEVVGMENPYTRYRYPEAPGFDYFVFDVYRGGRVVPPLESKRLAEEHGLRHVPVLGVIGRGDVEELRRMLETLEQRGREGVVLKDAEGRVPPLKYTTSYINKNDLELGMRFFFEEGRSFLFSRVLRQVFKAYEEGWRGDRLYEEECLLGRVIIEPAVKAIRSVEEGTGLYEEYTLRFASHEEIREFEDYM